MPLYYFRCPSCNTHIRRLLKPEESEKVIDCAKCGNTYKRINKPATVKITETLDNGVMVRKLERLADAEQIHYERAHGKKGVI